MNKQFDVIIVANGKSIRAGIDKLSYLVGDTVLINKTINCFKDIDFINNIILVSDNENFNFENVTKVNGGKTRQESVLLGLKKATSEYVLIHDGARPFVSKILINTICKDTLLFESSIPYTKPNETMYRIQNTPKYEDRDEYIFIQTPQGFKKDKILKAYYENTNTSLTDDSSIYMSFFNSIHFTPGEIQNRKITTIEDLQGINNKIGIGFDVHKLIENGKPIKLGGITIDNDLGIEAHSDGDVLLHSLSDAILSCANSKDIGVLFPDTKEETLNLDSRIILNKALNLLYEKNMKINSISIIIIALKPKVSKYIDSIILNLSTLCNLPPDKISITATTTENLGIFKDGKAICVFSEVSCN